MWYSFNLFAVILASLFFCTCTAFNSYAEFDSLNAGQYPSNHQDSWTGLDDERNTYSYGTDSQRDLPSNYLDLSSWPERESATISRQLFGNKASESSESHGLDDNEEDISKSKRESHSLSIVNPLDVLRQRLMLEMARRRMKENQDQIRENAVILKNLGKRSVSSSFQENTGDETAEVTRTNQDYLRRIHVSNSEDFDI
ncbi:uncharacterized protein [Parasteatoda tepidariorum]|uniref:uncharacterized protein n=1 Tax=Parasteatoda tepidariorum TaxID=114398 RepID=UPI00077F9CC2|nr:uncharacterized protein LOC107452296 [Parasteatoda tepidariorum]